MITLPFHPSHPAMAPSRHSSCLPLSEHPTMWALTMPGRQSLQAFHINPIPFSYSLPLGLMSSLAPEALSGHVTMTYDCQIRHDLRELPKFRFRLERRNLNWAARQNAPPSTCLGILLLGMYCRERAPIPSSQLPITDVTPILGHQSQ